ncbi:MAG: PTS sugar transporter subunit IIA [Gammaproteobacteria bacterium]|nr:MAG: PTS sugar transporter subunit IIA [Gammaproteobacteria bacterium]
MLIAALLVNATNIDSSNTASSKKRIIENISIMLAKNTPEISADVIFNALIERERLGSTGLGKGVAIPHARIPGLTHTIAAMMTLDTPVNYESADNKSVDIVFGLLVPEEDGDKHLQHLARLVSLFRDQGNCQKIRDANNAELIFDILLAQDDD